MLIPHTLCRPASTAHDQQCSLSRWRPPPDDLLLLLLIDCLPHGRPWQTTRSIPPPHTDTHIHTPFSGTPSHSAGALAFLGAVWPERRREAEQAERAKKKNNKASAARRPSRRNNNKQPIDWPAEWAGPSARRRWTSTTSRRRWRRCVGVSVCVVGCGKKVWHPTWAECLKGG